MDEIVIIYSLVTFACCLSLIGNGATIFLVTKTGPERRSFNWEVIIMLAVSDILISLIGLCQELSYVISGSENIFDDWWFCGILGSLQHWLFGISFIFISSLAIDKFLIIFFSKRLKPVIGLSVIGILAIVYAGFVINNVLFGSFMPDPTLSHCLISKNSLAAIMLSAYSGAIFILSITVIFFSYIPIALYCWHKSRHSDSNVLRRASVRSLIILVLYFICLVPKFTSDMILSSKSADAPRFVHILSPIGLAFISFINPLLVLCIHTRYSQQAIQFLSREFKLLQINHSGLDI